MDKSTLPTEQRDGPRTTAPGGGSASDDLAPSQRDFSSENGTVTPGSPEMAPGAPQARRDPWAGRCGARTSSGGRCRVAATLCPTCGRCWAHCEHRKAEAQDRRRAGGRARRRDRWPLPDDKRPETPDEVLVLAGWALREVAAGRMDQDTARTIKSLCEVALRSARDAGLARRLKQLEERIGQLKHSTEGK